MKKELGRLTRISPIIFGCFYRPPETSNYLPKDYNELLNETITKVIKEQKETIIMGDFNIDYSCRNVSKDFKNLMSSYGFKQLVKTATRITKDTSSLIDLIFVNKPNSYPTVNVVSTSLSDHDLIGVTRKINTHKYPARVIKCRDYSKYNPELLV